MCFTDSTDITDQGVSAADIKTIVDTHNDVRGNVKPPATDLVTLVSVNALYEW